MRILAIDLGDRRTGVALSDPTGMIPGDAFTIDEKSRERLTDRLCTLCSERQVSRIVLGFPKNMNDTLGERAEKSLAFAESLREASKLPVFLWDERGSTISASRILSDAGKKRDKQRARVDAVAATIILQSYLDYLSHHPDKR